MILEVKRIPAQNSILAQLGGVWSWFLKFFGRQEKQIPQQFIVIKGFCHIRRQIELQQRLRCCRSMLLPSKRGKLDLLLLMRPAVFLSSSSCLDLLLAFALFDRRSEQILWTWQLFLRFLASGQFMIRCWSPFVLQISSGQTGAGLPDFPFAGTADFDQVIYSHQADHCCFSYCLWH